MGCRESNCIYFYHNIFMLISVFIVPQKEKETVTKVKYEFLGIFEEMQRVSIYKNRFLIILI